MAEPSGTTTRSARRRACPARAGRGPTAVRRDRSLPEDPVLLPLDLPGHHADDTVQERAVRTLQARLVAGQVVSVAPVGGTGGVRHYRLYAASPRGYTNISLVAAHALGMSGQLVRGHTAIATTLSARELVAMLARRIGLDGALVCRWT